MQAQALKAGLEIARGLASGIVVFAGVQRCPDCTCSPSLACASASISRRTQGGSSSAGGAGVLGASVDVSTAPSSPPSLFTFTTLRQSLGSETVFNLLANR